MNYIINYLMIISVMIIHLLSGNLFFNKKYIT
ncbi:hypothetical protein NAL19_2668 [Pectobacterium sp. F1-1]|nr:hypothetical protein NAL19_2668 [Pectobacterium sp. F1-1]